MFCFDFVIIIQALDTLGDIKWRVNKRLLGVVDRVWASGGKDAGLVERDDVSISLASINSSHRVSSSFYDVTEENICWPACH